MKKKMCLLLILMGAIFFAPSVMATNITGCESVIPGAVIDVKIANTVHTIILVIQIAVPILLVVFGMIDLFKAVMASKEDEIKKGRQTFIKRLLTAVIVFFVIAIVKFLISFVADDDGIITCANCFLNGADKTSGVCK